MPSSIILLFLFKHTLQPGRLRQVAASVTDSKHPSLSWRTAFKIHPGFKLARPQCTARPVSGSSETALPVAAYMVVCFQKPK